MCCTSLRGAAYFGASIHITLGAVLFIRYVIVTAFLTFFNVTDVIKDRITGYLLPFVAYITLFLAFGIVIFHSVEKEYFIILRWATLGFSILQILLLVALYTLRFLPTYEYRQFPFLPVSITDGYVTTRFQTTNTGGPTTVEHLSDDYPVEFLPKLTRSPGGVFPTSATIGSSSISSHGRSSGLGKPSSEEMSRGGGSESVSNSNFIHPVPTEPPNKWLTEVYSLVALIVMTIVSLVYLILLFLYVRQLIYEDSGHVYGHAQSVTRNVAFYVQPQFAQSGNSDNKLTNSPSPALRSKDLHGLQSQQANCTQPTSNTQIPSEFLPQPHNQNPHHPHNQNPNQPHNQNPHQSYHQNPHQPHNPNPHQPQRQNSNPHQSQHVGNHVKPGNSINVNSNQQNNLAHQQQQQNQGQNNTMQRSPVPPAKTMQQNIQTQQQQQVITIYPQKGGGYTSSSSSPRMQVKFAKPLEQHPSNTGSPGQSHMHAGDGMAPPEPPRSCLANPASAQCNMPPPIPPHSTHMMHPQQSQCQRIVDPGRNLSPAPGHYHQVQHQHHGQQQMQACRENIPPPLPPRQHHFQTPSHIQGQHGPPYTHQQQQPPQHMPYHGKSRAQQQSYNDMVDNSSYLVFSGNPNTSNLASAPPPPPPLASSSLNFQHCSQRRPSGSMV